ncbi:MAG: PAS domain S-box protein, partial [Opitutaceae bacterium]|nr:PAS domain S-box protein [Verrucomicrobiales bacterium]
VSPGDIVEAAGFPGEDPRRQVLREAMFRKTGMGTIPLPIKLSPTPWQTGMFENELISFEGTLLGSVGGSSNQLSLLLSHGNQSVTMTTERAQDMPVLARIPPGSILRVEGICHLPDPDSRSARSLQLWLPSAAAIEVVRVFHQWTGGEVALLTGLAFLIPSAGFWLLRRSKSRRSTQGQSSLDFCPDAARRYQELFENASDIICTIEPTGRITSLNRSGVALLGYSETEAQGLNISQLVVPSDWPRLRPLLEAREGDKTAVAEEFELVARDGRHVFLQINPRSVVREGQFAGVQAIARDVTERKRTEAELVRTAEGLQFSLAERERIGRDLHDSIIQSIYAVGLTLDDCRRNLQTAPEKAELRLDQGIEALNGLIREVRNYIEGLGPVMLQSHELEGALKSLVLTMGSARTVRFSLTLEPGIAELLHARQATEIFLIARELMGNCLRHSRASSARISLRAGRDCVILRIEDDGAGFDVDTRSPAGRGLRNISGRARDLAADFQIESNPGTGSVFTLEVPVTKPHHRNEIETPPTPAGG